MNQYKIRAIEIAEDLKGIDTSDHVIDNVQILCVYIIDALESVVGSRRYMRSEHENDILDFWYKVKSEALNIYDTDV